MDNEKIKEIQKSANNIFCIQEKIQCINEVLSKMRGHNLIRVDIYLEGVPKGYQNPIIIPESSIGDLTNISLAMTEFFNQRRIALEDEIEEIASRIEILK